MVPWILPSKGQRTTENKHPKYPPNHLDVAFCISIASEIYSANPISKTKWVSIPLKVKEQFRH